MRENLNILFHLHFSSSNLKKFFNILIFVLCINVLFFSCGSSENIDSEMTYTADRKDFSVFVETDGILEAKNNISVSPPQTLDSYVEITYIIPEGSEVKKDDILAVLKDNRLENEYENAQNQVDITKAELKKKKTQLKNERSQLESQLKINETSVAAKRLQLVGLEFAAPTKQEIEKLQIQKFEMEAEKLKRKLTALENIQKEELKYLEMKIVQAESKFNRFNRMKEQLTIKSPGDGIVTYDINRRTRKKVQLGDMVYRRYPIIKIPDLSKMQVRMQVSETDAQKLKEGQKAVIKITSLGDFELTGKVSNVDKVAKPVLINYRNSKIKRVDVVVEIDSTEIELVPGLTGECRIVIEEFENVLVLPKECIFEEDTAKFVYVSSGEKFIERPVELSYQSSDFVVVKDGIKNGEGLALYKPGSSLIK